MAINNDEFCVVLYLRRPVHSETLTRQEAVVGRLEWLRECGYFDRFEVRHWGWRENCARPRTPALLETIEDFEAWAERTNARLDPCINRKTIHSGFTGLDTECISLPVIALAIYEDHRLVDVYPSRTDTGLRTVDDALSRLEGDYEPRTAEDEPRARRAG